MNDVLLTGFFSELEEIEKNAINLKALTLAGTTALAPLAAHAAPAVQHIRPGSIAHRMALGAESRTAKESIKRLVSGGGVQKAAPAYKKVVRPSGTQLLGGAAKAPTAAELGIPGGSPF